MYGVIVVPMRAMIICTPPNDRGTDGTTRPWPTLPQSGCARMAAIGYATKTSAIARNARSTILYEPKTTSDQSSIAASGIAIRRGTLSNSAAAPTPTNSENVVPRFATRSASTTNDVMRTPKRSRTRSEKPIPVTEPSRAHISCTTMSATRITMSTQRSW